MVKVWFYQSFFALTKRPDAFDDEFLPIGFLTACSRMLLLGVDGRMQSEPDICI